MKKVIIEALKGYKWQIPIHIILIGINIYLLTIPAKIIGNIIDLLYDVELNRQAILNNTYYLLGSCIVLLAVRMCWKYLETYISRGVERDIKIKLFQRFLKLKLQNIQDIKNGEIMSYFVKDTNEIRSTVYRIISHGIRIVFTFILAIYQMAKGVNIYLTIAVMLPIILATIIVTE